MLKRQGNFEMSEYGQVRPSPRCEAARVSERGSSRATGPQDSAPSLGWTMTVRADPEGQKGVQGEREFAARPSRWLLAVGRCCSTVECCYFFGVERKVAPSFG
jgi:hypothetical protein